MTLDFIKPLSLTQLAIIQVSQQIWKSNRTQIVMKTLLSDEFLRDETGHSYCRTIAAFYKDMSRYLHEFSLPCTLIHDLKTAIGILGDHTLLWLCELVKLMKPLDENFVETVKRYIDNIKWNSIGIVDIKSTFLSVFSIDSQGANYFMWLQASELCLEEYIIQWSPGMQPHFLPLSIDLLFQGQDLMENPDCYYGLKFWEDHREILRAGYSYHLPMFWKLWKYRIQTEADWNAFISFLRFETDDNYEIYDDRDAIEENMLRLSIVDGKLAAMKYFWEKLGENQRKRNVVRMAAVVAWCHQTPVASTGPRVKSTEYVDIFGFLIEQMVPDDLNELLNNDLRSEVGYLPMYDVLDTRSERKYILSMLLHSTWRHLLVPIAAKAMPYIDSSEYNYLILEILRPAVYDIVMMLHNAYHIFHDWWKLSSKELKLSISLENCLNTPMLQTDPITFMRLLKCVINDPDLVNEKQRLIDCVQAHSSQLILDRKLYFLKLFVAHALTSEQERHSFKSKIDFSFVWENLTARGEHDLKERFINWMRGMAD